MAPTSAPTEVPQRMSGLMFALARARKTPICAQPRAPPPPRANPITGLCIAPRLREEGCVLADLDHGRSIGDKGVFQRLGQLRQALRLAGMAVEGSGEGLEIRVARLDRAFRDVEIG